MGDDIVNDEFDEMERILEEAAEEADLDKGPESGGEGRGDDDQAQSTEKKKVKPRKVTINPRPKLDPQRLTGPRGIGVIESMFEGFKFKGKGHEVEDLSRVLAKLEHWAHRLFPKMTFEDCIGRIEELGSKRPVIIYLTKIRLGMESDPTVQASSEIVHEDDPFDALIDNPPQEAPQELTEEQRARMLRNRLIAEERRMARLKAMHEAKSAPTAEQRAETETVVELSSQGNEPVLERNDELVTIASSEWDDMMEVS